MRMSPTTVMGKHVGSRKRHPDPPSQKTSMESLVVSQGSYTLPTVKRDPLPHPQMLRVLDCRWRNLALYLNVYPPNN